ncbi:MAG: putative tricarboxylic transport membrane protein, partial [Gammaproteobacteria bacterium]
MDFSVDMATILGALATVLEPFNLFILVCGVVGGIIIGIIPGLGPTMGIALLIPFTFTLPPEVGLSLLVAIFVGGISGGCVTAILIRMPGTPASVATLLDGFPMARDGRAGQAIGNAVVASFVGTIISGILLVLFAPMLAAFAIKFHFAEYVAVCVFALTAVAAITGSTISRGLFTAGLGLLCATVGLSEEDALPRFDFGASEFSGGIQLIPALIGLFAISQIMHDSVRTDRGER